MYEYYIWQENIIHSSMVDIFSHCYIDSKWLFVFHLKSIIMCPTINIGPVTDKLEKRSKFVPSDVYLVYYSKVITV